MCCTNIHHRFILSDEKWDAPSVSLLGTPMMMMIPGILNDQAQEKEAKRRAVSRVSREQPVWRQAAENHIPENPTAVTRAAESRAVATL